VILLPTAGKMDRQDKFNCHGESTTLEARCTLECCTLNESDILVSRWR
jgi:hypothetical protein